MFQRFRQTPGSLENLDRFAAWTRAQFGLRSEVIVLMREESSGLPGIPACDTTVRLWTRAGVRYRVRIFKPEHYVTRADLPPTWLLPSLQDDGVPDCG